MSHSYVVHGPGFRVAFDVDPNRTNGRRSGVRQETYRKSSNYLGGWTPAATVSTSREHAANSLKVARHRSDCHVHSGECGAICR